MMGREWKTALVVLAAVAVGVLLGGSGVISRAYAVSTGQSSGVVALLGDERSGAAPIILVDIPDETVIAYEYSYSNNEIELTSARTFRYDKLLTDWQSSGPSVDEVRSFVSKQK
jgi:hypothetical protein